MILYLIFLIGNKVDIFTYIYYVFRSVNCLFISLPIFLFCFFFIDLQEIYIYSKILLLS